MGVLELRDTHLGALSSLSESSGTAQVHRDWRIIEVSRYIRGVISLETVLVVVTNHDSGTSEARDRGKVT